MARARTKAWGRWAARAWFVGVISTSSTWCATATVPDAWGQGALAKAGQWRPASPQPWQIVEPGQRSAGAGAGADSASLGSPAAEATPQREGAGWLFELLAQRQAAKLSVGFVFQAVSRAGAVDWMADNASGPRWGQRCQLRSLIPAEMELALGNPLSPYKALPRSATLGFIAAHEAAHCAAALDPAVARRLALAGSDEAERERLNEAMADLYAIALALDREQGAAYVSAIRFVDPRDPHSNAGLIASALSRGAASQINGLRGRQAVARSLDLIVQARDRSTVGAPSEGAHGGAMALDASSFAAAPGSPWAAKAAFWPQIPRRGDLPL